MKKLITLFAIILPLWSIMLIDAHGADNPSGRGGGGFGYVYSSKVTNAIWFHGHGENWGVTFDIFFEGLQAGEQREAGTSNYGRTKVGEDIEEIFGGSLGVTRKVFQYLWLGLEASIGEKTTSSQYSDGRFTEGYYYSEDDSEFLIGVGAQAIIPVFKHLSLIGGYNTVKGAGIGMALTF